MRYCKPILRKLTSITQEEKRTFVKKFGYPSDPFTPEFKISFGVIYICYEDLDNFEFNVKVPLTIEEIQWFREKQFDLDGLIERNLAIDRGIK